MSPLSSFLALLLLMGFCSVICTGELLCQQALTKEVNDLKSQGVLLIREVNRLSRENEELRKEIRQTSGRNETGFIHLHDNSILVFRLTAGAGSSPYAKYKSVGSNDDHSLVDAGWNCGCRTVDGLLPCDRHYRSRFLDLWPSALIDTVRLSVYDHGRQVAFVEFNGRGTTYTNWFSADRVLDSSWKDLKTEPHNFFSLAGDESSLARKFFINRSYGGCPGDRGWLVVKEISDVCSWGQKPPYPSILYSKLPTYGDPNNPLQFGQADVMTVTVKLRTDVDRSHNYCH